MLIAELEGAAEPPPSPEERRIPQLKTPLGQLPELLVSYGVLAEDEQLDFVGGGRFAAIVWWELCAFRFVTDDADVTGDTKFTATEWLKRDKGQFDRFAALLCRVFPAFAGRIEKGQGPPLWLWLWGHIIATLTNKSARPSDVNRPASEASASSARSSSRPSDVGSGSRVYARILAKTIRMEWENVVCKTPPRMDDWLHEQVKQPRLSRRASMASSTSSSAVSCPSFGVRNVADLCRIDSGGGRG